MFQAFPSYDTTPHEWAIGITPPDSGGQNISLTQTVQKWLIDLNPFPVQPGEYDLSGISFRVNGLSDGSGNLYVDKGYLVIYALDSGTFKLKVWIDITGDLPTDQSGDDTVTIDLSPAGKALHAKAGEVYFWGIALLGKDGRPQNLPRLKHQAANAGPVQSYMFNNQGSPTVPCLPLSLTASSADHQPGGTGSHLLGKLTFTTTTRKVFSLGSDASPFFTGSTGALMQIVPHRTDGNYWIVLRSTKTTGDDVLQVDLSYGNSSAGQTVLDTLQVDMGATDKVVFHGNSVNLNGTTSEDDDIIDFAVLVRSAEGTTRGNAFWVNRTVGQGPGGHDNDIVTISHRTKFEASHDDGKLGYELDANAFRPAEYLDVTSQDQTDSTAIISVELADALYVAFGDSNVGKQPGVTPAAPQRLGAYFYMNLAQPLPWWVAGIPNDALATDVELDPDLFITAGYKRYCHPTPGEGDICDMWNMLLLVQIGGNDIQKSVLSSEDDRNRFVADMTNRLFAILSDCFANDDDRSNRAILFGMPPYRDSSPAVEPFNREAFIQWSEAVMGLAAAYRVSFYNPFYDVMNNWEFQNSDGVHYSDTGADAICAVAAVAYESNRFGGSGIDVY